MALTSFSSGVNTSFSTELNTNYDFIYNQAMLNAVASSRTTNDDEQYYYASVSTSTVDYSSSTCFRKGDYAFCLEFDYFTDGSIDADIWTTGVSGSSGGSNTVTETGTGESGYMQLYAETSSGATGVNTAYAQADDSANTAYVDIRDCEVIINIDYSHYVASGTSGANVYTSLVLRDSASNEDTLHTIDAITTTGTNSGRDTWRIVVNATTDTVYVYDSLEATTPVATKSLVNCVNTNEWYIKVVAYNTISSGTGTSCTTKIYAIGYADGTTTSSVYQSDAITITTGATSGIYKDVVYNGTATYEVSYNNGSNYTTITPGQIYTGVTTGTQMILKVTDAPPGTIGVSATSRNIPSMPLFTQFMYS